MRRKLSVREIAYKEDLEKAAKRNPAEKLKLALELSDFCRYLRSKVLAHKGKNDRV